MIFIATHRRQDTYCSNLTIVGVIDKNYYQVAYVRPKDYFGRRLL